MEPFYYLLVNLGCLLVPFLVTFHPRFPDTRGFYRRLLIAIPGMMLLFIPWDAIFTANGVWSFSTEYTLGPSFSGLPMEEWMFFVCIPFACLFTYECLKVFWPDMEAGRGTFMFTAALGLFFIGIAMAYHQQAYTFWSHLLCGMLLLIQSMVIRGAYMSRFFIMYLMIFPAFIASNGVLTGLEFWKYPLIHSSPESIADQIVWYNNEENLGVRIFSVPVDDVSYGMLMLLLSITIYEAVNKRSRTEAGSRV